MRSLSASDTALDLYQRRDCRYLTLHVTSKTGVPRKIRAPLRDNSREPHQPLDSSFKGPRLLPATTGAHLLSGPDITR